MSILLQTESATFELVARAMREMMISTMLGQMSRRMIRMGMKETHDLGEVNMKDQK